MPKINITEETRNKAIRLYRNKALTLTEIANLLGTNIRYLNLIYRAEFEKGTLKPRREIGLGIKGGNAERRKFTAEQEQQIAHDYYNSTCRATEFMAKWGLHPMQLQRIRKTYGANYEKKKVGRRKGDSNE